MRRILTIIISLLAVCLPSVAQNNPYEIEHETIEEEIRKSMVYHRYQDAVLGRWESACRDLGLVDEQKEWLLDLLMAEKNKVDEQLASEGGGHI